MALKLGRFVSHLGRNLASRPSSNPHVSLRVSRCLSIVPSDSSSRIPRVPMRTPKPLSRNLFTPSLSLSNAAQSAAGDNATPPAKWEGKAVGKVSGVSADQVWSQVEDFGNVHKWLPTIDSTSLVEGEPGKLGCVRRCSGPPAPGSDVPTFTNEKLVEFDPATRTLSYRVLENNIGFGDFVATWKVVPDSDGGCSIEWSYVSSPIPYWDPEKVMGYIGFSVQGMAKAMEGALSPQK
ncbi:hypothetical protein H6P81_009097 [Aristolochia fimbriata]|uniref:Uncharacterized protein n=1 Tax=Aristolochia fimbriata TaxID=158543 RepID=A0AAV7EN23_ARIFI|nr:hypothetical protein H6P81_009097 [Aristolochia fimbriata]